MNRSIGLKKSAAIVMSFLLLFAIALSGVVAIPAYAAPSFSHEYTVDLAKAYQEFDGWGLSLSWWATEIGNWTRIGSSGHEKREEIMEAIYGKSGLNLNIARYNVGGGDDPAHTHMTDDRNTPGWKGAHLEEVKTPEEPAAGAAEEGEEAGGEENEPVYELVPDEKYFYEDEEGNILDWTQTPDWRQLWVMNWIQENRDERGEMDKLITEYYSNSPPYWMTMSGCSSGGEGAGQNLANDKEHNLAFVEYFLDVYEYLVSQGFVLQNLQPFNESGSKYWGLNGDQEGCYFSPEQKAEVLGLLIERWTDRGMNEKYGDLVYNFGDETNTDVAQDQYSKARNYTTKYNTAKLTGKAITNGASRLTYHIYSYNNNTMKRMYHNAHYNNQEIYMSEICWTEGDEYDPDDLTTGFKYVDSIVDTVKYGGVDAYVFWQGMEDMVGQMKSHTNYGLIQGVYYTQEEAESQGVDLAAMGLNYQDFILSKAYYLSGQYTKYIDKGYRLVEINDSRTMAAISPDGKTLVIVKENKGDDADSFKINLDGFKAGSVYKVYTDATHSWATASVSTTGSAIYDTVGKKSVTTYIISGTRTGREGHFIDDSDADDGLHDGTSVYNLDRIKAKITERGNVEGSYATYNIMDSWGGDYGYFGSTSKSAADGQFYQVYHFKGVGFAIAAPTKNDLASFEVWIDKDPAVDTKDTTVSLNTSTAVSTGVVYERKDLADEWHTVYVKAASAGGKNWANFDGIYVYEALDAVSETELYISDASGVGSDLTVTYEATGYDDYTLYLEYRATGEVKWKRSATALSGGQGLLEVDAEQVELRIVAVKDEYVEYSPVYVAKLLTTTDGVLYFVDCGTGDDNAIANGAVLGEYQSSSDKKYGEDGVTGKTWGYTNTLKEAGDKGYFVTDDAMSSVMSTEKFNQDALEYKFEIPSAGTYKMALGFFGGGSSWGTRGESITVTSTSGVNEVKEIDVKENEYNALYYSLNLTAGDVLTVQVAKKAGESQAAMISLIVITEESVKLPLYTEGASSYNNVAAVKAMGNVSVGEDMFAKFDETEVTVYLSDGTTDLIKAGAPGVSFTATTGKIIAGQNATAAFVSDKYEGLEAYATYSWYQEGARELYYNIDIGYVGDNPPDDATLLGSKQSTTKDRIYGLDAAKGTSWGATEGYNPSNFEEGVNWKNDGSNEWSMRESKVGDGSVVAYKMTGFKANEELELTTGAHLDGGWGERTYAVVINGTTMEERITLPNSNERVFVTYTCNADENGELEVKAKSETKGRGPHMSYIKVYSSGGNLPKSAAITSDKMAAGRDGTITLKNLIVGGTVYAIGENGEFYGSFMPTAPSQAISVADFLPDDAYTMQLVQAEVGYNVSIPLTVDVPALSFSFDDMTFVREGDAVVITFKPLVSKGVTSLTLKLPSGANVDVTDGFYYRATKNGDYKITLVSNGVSTSREFTISTLDVVTLGEVFSTTGWTAEDVVITLDPTAVSGKATKVLIDGAPATAGADGKYTITAHENKDYEITVTTPAGFEYIKTISVTNINRTTPEASVSFDFSAVGGVTLNYEAVSETGGTLKFKLNGGAEEEVSDEKIVDISREGKYEIYYVGGNGIEVAVMTYYVTYGAEKANLASVAVGEDGTLTVTEKTRAVPAYKLYRAGGGEEVQKADKTGKYYLEITSGEEKEIVVINVTAKGNNILDKTPYAMNFKKGNAGAMAAGIVLGVLALAGAAVVCVLVLKGKLGKKGV